MLNVAIDLQPKKRAASWMIVFVGVLGLGRRPS